MGDGYLTYDGVSELTGSSVETLRTLHWRAKKNRDKGTPKPGDMPPPDKIYGRTPTWLPETIRKWRGLPEPADRDSHTEN